VYSVWCIVYCVLCIVYSVLCIGYSVFALYGVHSVSNICFSESYILCGVSCIVYCVFCLMSCVFCLSYRVSSIVCCALCIVQYVYTVCCALCFVCIEILVRCIAHCVLCIVGLIKIPGSDKAHPNDMAPSYPIPAEYTNDCRLFSKIMFGVYAPGSCLGPLPTRPRDSRCRLRSTLLAHERPEYIIRKSRSQEARCRLPLPVARCRSAVTDSQMPLRSCHSGLWWPA
jgi:hypothetical protein